MTLADAAILAALAILPFLVKLLSLLRTSMNGIALLLAVAIPMSIAGHFLVGMSNTQSFAANSQLKRILLPCLYIVAFTLLASISMRQRSARSPKTGGAWPFLLLLALAGGTLSELLSNSDDQTYLALIQGILLVVGFLLFYFLGSSASDIDPPGRLAIYILLFMGTVAVAVAGTTQAVMPFISISVPILAWSVLNFRYWRKFPLYLLGLGFSILALIRVLPHAEKSEPDVSGGLLAQIAACGAWILVSLTPRRYRLPVGGLIAGAALFLGLQSGLVALTFGVTPDGADVTLAQRSYETSVAFQAINSNLIQFVLGAGPGSTVSLTSSPDAETLYASGRDLAKVDDVHLLTSWFLLKFGIFGIVILVTLTILVLRLCFASRTLDSQDPMTVLASLLVLAAIGTSLPAATNFWTNPILPLMLGYLSAAPPPQITSSPHFANR